MSFALAVGPGDGKAIRQADDAYYVCDLFCLSDAIARNVSPDWAAVCDTVNEWAGEPCLFTDGRPTGDVATWEIIRADSEPSCHEYCWACGDLVAHGLDDDYVCDGEVCEAPEYI